MRLKEEILALREREEGAHDRQPALSGVQVELAEPAMCALPVDRLDVRHDRSIAGPREHVRAVAVRAEHRDDAGLAEDRAQTERAFVGRARDEAGLDAELIEHGRDLLRRIRGPRFAAVVEMRVEDR